MERDTHKQEHQGWPRHGARPGPPRLLGRWGLAIVAAASLLTAAPAARAGAPDDDLAVVKRALAGRQEPGTATSPRESIEATPAPDRGARWLRLRVVAKRAREEVVSLRVPLGLARCLDGASVARGRGGDVHLGELLRALEAGREFVRVEDDDTLVRIWLE